MKTMTLVAEIETDGTAKQMRWFARHRLDIALFWPPRGSCFSVRCKQVNVQVADQTKRKATKKRRSKKG